MNDFFCGWYFKCQSARQSLALIPAVHSHHGVRSCSVQLITEDANWDIPLSWSGVQMRRDRPCAVLGNNEFSPQSIRLDLHTADCHAEGELQFGTLSPIRYDIMGPFRYVPFLECRHSVVSMRHRVTGSLAINGREYRFEDGVGYLEGDRGRSFPNYYAWTQCCFPEGALMLSVAEIPLGPIRFTGVIGVVQLGKEEYRLASYLGAKAVRIHNGELVVRQGDLQFTAALLERKAFSLQAPVSGQMTRTIRENVACHARYQLLREQRVLLDFESTRASFEYEYPDRQNWAENGRVI